MFSIMLTFWISVGTSTFPQTTKLYLANHDLGWWSGRKLLTLWQ